MGRPEELFKKDKVYAVDADKARKLLAVTTPTANPRRYFEIVLDPVKEEEDILARAQREAETLAAQIPGQEPQRSTTLQERTTTRSMTP